MLASAVAPALPATDASTAAQEQCEDRIAPWRSPEAQQMPQSDLEALREVAGRARVRRLL